MPHRPLTSERAFNRRFLTALAIVILLLMVGLGLAYLRLWARAADDLTRLLPAHTEIYLAAPTPTTLKRTQPGSFFGLPREFLPDLLLSSQSLEFALVPTRHGYTAFAFLEKSDPRQYQRLLNRLTQNAEIIDRRLGFPIYRPKAPDWADLIGLHSYRPRIVALDPWIVLSWGDPEALNQLIQARVGGRSDSLWRTLARPLYIRPAELTEVFIDLKALWRTVKAPLNPSDRGLLRHLRPLKVTTPPFTLELPLTPALSDAFDAFSPSPLSFIADAPSDSAYLAEFFASDLSKAAPALQDLFSRLHHDLALTDPSLRLSQPFLTALSALSLPPIPGAISILGLEGKDRRLEPTLVIHSSESPLVEALIDSSLHLSLGGDFAFGTLSHAGHPTHIVTPSQHPTPEHALFVWRRHGDTLHLAPSLEALAHLEHGPFLSASPGRLSLLDPQPAAARIVLFPQTFRALAHALPMGLESLSERHLDTDATLSLALHPQKDHLHFLLHYTDSPLPGRSFLDPGPLVDTLTLATVPATCRPTLLRFCDAFPNSLACDRMAYPPSPYLAALCPRPAIAPPFLPSSSQRPTRAP